MNTLSTEVRTAAKPHQCDACEGDIMAGERYQITVSADRDRIGNWRQHLCCTEAERYYADQYDDGFTGGWIVEELSRGGEEFPTELRDRLLAASRSIAPDLAGYAWTMERIAEWEAEPSLKQLGHRYHIASLYLQAARQAVRCPRLCAQAAERAAFGLDVIDRKIEAVRVGIEAVDAAIGKGKYGRREVLAATRERLAKLLAALEREAGAP